MEKYGTETTLLENQLYTVTLKLKGETTSVSFTSQYSPLFSTVRIVRSDFRELFSRYIDDEINRRIHDNSKLALEIANPEINLNEEIPFYVKQYVRYKTDLDLMTDLVYNISTQGGAQEKLLGDLKITKEINTRDLDKLLDRLQKQLAPWESQLAGMRTRPRSAIRAGSNEYPINGRLF